MSKFESLSGAPVKEREAEISEYWDKIDLLHKSVDSRDSNKPFVFYEGPPTANGQPGIHHVMGRSIKDLVCRYKTMEGYQVNRKAGWDTHGLPVEIEVEKTLGLKNKQGIEEYGIEKFNEQCKKSVFKYEKQWRELTKRMGYLIDLDDPYITLENDYIESVWWILDKFFKEGYIYEGHKILPYCTRCGTGLASHEVAQGYQEITSETVIAKFKLKDKENEYFLAWTTTPWTLPANVALTVNPTEVYIKAEQDGEIYYLAKTLAGEVLGDEYEILEEMPGQDMEYMEYEQLLPFVEADKKAFFVTVDDYVTMEDGTGIVHSAPAFGEDDYEVGLRYDLPVLNPVAQTGEFITTPWEGKFVMDADPEIVEYLRESGQMYRKQRMDHNYPHCWRCDTPLLYYANPSWYIEMTKLKDQLIENNNRVNWYPDHVGEGRFGNWLENLNDWAISRSRYWGTPFPIWKCDDCDHVDSVGSRQELADRAIEEVDPETIELHRPYVDDIHLKCDKCNGQMTREEDVVDVWFDSGAMPFAQWHYPFENKENFDSLFPADFISEGIDQTRGWFYSLIAISTFVTGKAPYKNVLVNDLVLDEEGKKMSKSRGNTVDPFTLFDKHGADVLRWYLVHVSPPWTTTRFDLNGLREVESKFFRSFRNTYNFFSMYANTDEIDPRDFFVPYEDRPEIDRWLLSKYNSLVEEIKSDMDEFEITRVVRNIQEFVIEDLSNWYIRRNRRRFWSTELTDDKKAVYNTTYEVLLGLTKMIAPFVPFMAEEIYQKLADGESVHLEYYPESDSNQINLELEKSMDLVRDLVGLGRASREAVQIKVRQPIQEVVIDGKYEEDIDHLIPLIQEELNVKEVVFEKDLSQFMNFSLKPNFPVAGPKLGNKVGPFAGALKQIDARAAVESFEAGEKISLNLAGEDLEVSEDMVEVSIHSKEGFDVMMERNLFIILDTTLTKELLREGYAREFISKIQQMRRANDYEVLDNINIYYNGSELIQDAIEEYEAYIKSETLAKSINLVDEDLEEEDLNGVMTGIKLERL